MFGFSPAITGLAAGLILGAMSMATLNWVAGRIEDKASSDQQRQKARLLRNIAWLDVVLLAAVGYFVGPMLFG